MQEKVQEKKLTQPSMVLSEVTMAAEVSSQLVSMPSTTKSDAYLFWSQLCILLPMNSPLCFIVIAGHECDLGVEFVGDWRT